MAKNQNRVVFGDASWPLDSLEKIAANEKIKKKSSKTLLQTLRTKYSQVEFIDDNPSKNSKSGKRTQARAIPWRNLVSDAVDRELRLLALENRVEELRNFLGPADKIGILLQDDPDPDGLAGALALRKLLGRNSQSSEILTMGAITRPENMAMAKLLDIEVRQVQAKDLSKFDRVVLVDCQPSFFKGRKFKVDVVLDHHPHALTQPEKKEDIPFCEIRDDLGATSTLMTLFLRAAGVEISQRLATALLYGIKADTLMLNRQVSDNDLEAFVYLYPRINNNILRKIERPELPLAYLESLRKGMKYLHHKEGLVVLPLVECRADDWIPRAADFAMQTEGALWAVACGVWENQVVLSGRNCGFVQHCGDFFKEVFEEMGCAGGHRTMAKALIPIAQWTQRFGEDALKPQNLGEVVAKLFSELKVVTPQYKNLNE